MARNRLANMLFDDDSDDEFQLLAITVIEEEEEMANEDRTSRRRGSILGHTIIQRDRVAGNDRLYRDYFAETPTFSPCLFRRRFRINRSLFFRIQHGVEAYDPYFVQRRDACGVDDLSSLQKISATFRMLAYGVPADSVDKYVRIGESTIIDSLKKFVKAIIAVFGDEYLRSPNNDDITRLLEFNSRRGFLGMLGRSLNDINVLERSTLFNDLAEGRAAFIDHSINGHENSMRYYLADSIYPSWSTFVKTIPSPIGNKNKHFAASQESARKDVERAFGVLQSRFTIVHGSIRFWDQETLSDIIKACIIMHKMVVEDEIDIGQLDFNYDMIEENQPVSVSHEHTNSFSTSSKSC